MKSHVIKKLLFYSLAYMSDIGSLTFYYSITWMLAWYIYFLWVKTKKILFYSFSFWYVFIMELIWFFFSRLLFPSHYFYHLKFLFPLIQLTSKFKSLLYLVSKSKQSQSSFHVKKGSGHGNGAFPSDLRTVRGQKQ